MTSAPASPQLSDGENGVDRRELDEENSTISNGDSSDQLLTNIDQASKMETDQAANDDVTTANGPLGTEQAAQSTRDSLPKKASMPRASAGRSCIRCGFVSRSEAAAARHRLTGHSGLEYVCGDGGKCDRRATTSRLMAAHRARTHQSQQPQGDASGSAESKTTNVAPGSGVGGIYACGECPYRSSSPSHVASHGRLHVQPDRPHHCPECTYSVDRRSLLGQHIRLHQQQQQQQQDDKQQRDNVESVTSSSTAAEKQQPAPRRLRCSECPFRCRSASQLSTHRQRHVVIKEGRLRSMSSTDCAYRCDKCSFYADVRNALAHHRLLHGAVRRRRKQTSAARRRR
jgi:hypothetical protein